MRTLEFYYRMKLQFGTMVHGHEFALRFVPHTDQVQKIKTTSKSVQPFDWLHEDTDAFGNHLYVGRCAGEHDYFMCEVEGTAEVDCEARGPEPLDYCYRYPTRLTAYGKPVEEMASGIKERDVSDFKKACLLMQTLYDTFTYQPGVTTIYTTACEALELGKGVCQDYAHCFITLCRYCGIPARYVAGLMIGEGATHAWTEIYDEGMWKGFDPTNNRFVDDFYIKLSHGRDYTDCLLDRGVFFPGVASGGGSASNLISQDQEIYVKVEEKK